MYYQGIYFTAALIMSAGLFIMLTSDNYLRKIIGLGIFQSSVLLFYLATAKAKTGILPINQCTYGQACIHTHIYSSPLPHVLMPTAIVVGFATLAVGLALIYRISTQFGTILESEVAAQMEKNIGHIDGNC